MTLLAVILCIVCQIFLVVGQLFLKRGMTPAEAHAPGSTWVAFLRLLPGIACLTAWFFLWLGLLQQWELSHIFPFEGLNPALLVLGAAVFLKERLTAVAWVGIGLITVGAVLVGGS